MRPLRFLTFLAFMLVISTIGALCAAYRDAKQHPSPPRYGRIQGGP